MVSLSLIRAPLFVPADRPERFEKAAQSGADAVILDLEDAVAVDRKDLARTKLQVGFGPVPVIIRINPVGSQWYERDVAAITALRPDAVMLPKADDALSVAQVVGALDALPVIALIESAQGLSNARAIAATAGVVRLAFGSIDFCADLGCEHLPEVLLPARMELVMASRLTGIAPPIDGVTMNLHGQDDVHADALHARALGMAGKLCIHPRQIDPVVRAFAPSAEEREWAAKVLQAGDGVSSIDGMMVDEPVRRRAQRIIELSTTSLPTTGASQRAVQDAIDQGTS